MPRPKSTPSYCLHRSSGQAYVTLNGREVYLGEHGSRASREKYDRLVSEWLAAGRELPALASGDAPVGPTVTMIIEPFWEHVKTYYRGPDGEKTSEVYTFKQALKVLRRLFGATPAPQFGPLRLQALRDEMIRIGRCRTYINKQVDRVRMAFRWAASRELLPESVYRALETVDGLRKGRTEAKERARVKPVADAVVDATLEHLSPIVAAMVRLQQLTGMRPSELCKLRVRDIDRTRTPWQYRPPHHKNSHHEHERVIDFGPTARELLTPFLLRPDDAYVFSPAEAEVKRLAEIHEHRKQFGTPLSCGNRPGKRSGGFARRPRRRPGEHYTRDSYRRAIARACDRADIWAKGGRIVGNDERLVPHWHPHQIRHAAASKWRAKYGPDMALTLLGDKTTRMVDVYAEKDRAAAALVMEQIG